MNPIQEKRPREEIGPIAPPSKRVKKSCYKINFQDNSTFLDGSEKERFSNLTFDELIKRAVNENSFFILALVEDGERLDFFDGREITNWNEEHHLNPITRAKIEKIHYFVLENSEFSHITTKINGENNDLLPLLINASRDPACMYQLGLACRDGWHTTQNIARAEHFNHLAAQQNSVDALIEIALEQLPHADENQSQLMVWIKKILNLSSMSLAAKAVPLYTFAANHGDAVAQYYLACCYMAGTGIRENKPEAFRFFTLAANQGNARAQRCLAHCYNTGSCTAVNLPEAIRLYTLAANQGDAIAQRHLADCHKTGRGTTVNLPEAFRLYSLAANQGDAIAQRHLADCHRTGRGTAVNLPEAFRLYTLAANQGDAIAQFMLASFYQLGDVTPASLPEVIRYLMLAANQGLPPAQYLLAKHYEEGNGIPESLPEALRLYKLAASQGYPQAISRLQKLLSCSLTIDR
jgi:TPR repeat protein